MEKRNPNKEEKGEGGAEEGDGELVVLVRVVDNRTNKQQQHSSTSVWERSWRLE